jgi:FKBP-type peptidyl-prolyl cis-trans isomerase
MSAPCVGSLASTVARAGVGARELRARHLVSDGLCKSVRRAGRRADRASRGNVARLDVCASSGRDTRFGEVNDQGARFTRGVVAATAALAIALTPGTLRAEELGETTVTSSVAIVAQQTMEETVSQETTSQETTSRTTEETTSSSGPEAPDAPDSRVSDPDLEDPVEIPYDFVAVGESPDIEGRKLFAADLQKRGLSDADAKAIENNQKIKQYNNAPDEFPTFVREGYDVRVITADGFVTQANGLVYKDFVTGKGAQPIDGQEVTFEYIAYNENGGTIDSTYRKGVPASTRLGINGMIPGFEEGLKSMRPGGKRRVVVPPELGPPTGPATFFSAKQWEVFDIELIDVKSCTRVQSSFMSSSVVCE